MDETTNTATQPEQTTTPAGAAQTQSTAGNVDMATIEQKAQERAERAATAVVKDMLKQSGLDDAAIQTMLADWKSKQTTPEDTIKQLQGDVAARDAKIAEYERYKVMQSHGFSDKDEQSKEDWARYEARISQIAVDGKTFEQAAQEYFEAHPRKPKASASATNSGTGRTSMTATELDSLKADYEKAAKRGDSAKMAELHIIAKQKGFTLD